MDEEEHGMTIYQFPVAGGWLEIDGDN